MFFVKRVEAIFTKVSRINAMKVAAARIAVLGNLAKNFNVNFSAYNV